MRRRVDEVFGEVFGEALPTVTSDELDVEGPTGRRADEELLANRPPHHDRG